MRPFQVARLCFAGQLIPEGFALHLMPEPYFILTLDPVIQLAFAVLQKLPFGQCDFAPGSEQPLLPIKADKPFYYALPVFAGPLIEE